MTLSRRQFLVSAGLLATGTPSFLRAASPALLPVYGFSKPFQNLAPAAAAEWAAAVGWAGIECPIRRKGQVEPARVDDELPPLLAALAERGLTLPQAATDILRLDQPDAERVLRACARHGVKRLRLGFFRYRSDRTPEKELEELKPVLTDIAAACQELGLWAGVQNHSGSDWVGGPVWDIVGLLREINSPALGLCFDIGHATIEGGLSWPLEERLAEPFRGSVIVKDFRWERHDGRWREAWCPLGEGMIDRAFIDRLKKSSFRGPIIQHHEYEISDPAALRAAMKRDLLTLQSWLQ